MMLLRHIGTWLLLVVEFISVASADWMSLMDQQTSRRLQVPDLGDGEIEENNEYLGIPGTTQTINGYDTALGNEAICWKGAAADLSSENSTLANNDAIDLLVKTVFPNPLVEDFLLLGQTEILKRCPKGNTVAVERPEENIRGERLRTLQWYNYSLDVSIDLDTLGGDYIVTDDGTATIALQVVVCSLGKSGFCSPFVHEQANAREAIDKANSGQEMVATAKKVTGDLHGGTHIHSPWVFLDLGTNRALHANVTIPMIVNHPGEYFVIGTVQLYTGINGSNAYRWDIANALHSGEGRYLLYQAPPTIMSVSSGVLHSSYAAIGIASFIIVLLITQAIRHRHHQVLQLSQGDFLLVFLFSALVSTSGSFLFNPKSDIYCRIANPVVLIPIQLMYAITVGRMWRIHAVISPLLLEHLNKGRPGVTQRFVQAITFVSFKLHNLFICDKEKLRRSNGGAKQQISQFQLALVVTIFTLPQAVLQVVALLVQPQELQIQYNDDESVGRQTCGSGVPASKNLVVYGFFLLCLLVIILLVMAHSSRKLPSLFNETHVIYDSTFLSIVLLALGGAVIALTDDATTSPDVEYLVKMVLVLSITLNSAVRILVPKLQKVWKNEHVIVSKLVTDHHRRAREKQAERSSVMRGPNSVHVSGFDMSNSNKYHESFSKRDGDYDLAQTNRLMTIHSCSNDTGFINGSSCEGPQASNPFNSRSSGGDDSMANDSERPEPLSPEPPEVNTPNKDRQLEVIKESSKETPAAPKGRRRAALPGSASSTDPTSSIEFDVETGLFGPPPAQLTANKITPFEQGTNDDQGPVKVEAQSDDGGEATDDELEMVGRRKLPDRDRKLSFFDQGASGFLKSAMGISRRLAPKSERNVGDRRHKDQTHDKSDRSHRAEKSERSHKCEDQPTKKKLQKTIVVTEDETPARRLVLKMLDLQDQLEAVNNKIMSGLAVTQEDWGLITKLTSKLDRTFSDEVEFEWDLERRFEEELEEILPLDMSGRSLNTSRKKVFDSVETPKKTGAEKHVDDGTSRSSMKSARLKGIKRKTSNDKHRDLLGGSSHSMKSFASDSHMLSLADSAHLNGSNALSLGDSNHLKSVESFPPLPNSKNAALSDSNNLGGFTSVESLPPLLSRHEPILQTDSKDSIDEVPAFENIAIGSPSVKSPPPDETPVTNEPPSPTESPSENNSASNDSPPAGSPRPNLTEMTQDGNNTSGASHITVFNDDEDGRYFI